MFMVANLIRLGLHLNNMCLQLVVVLYPGLFFEKGTFFIIERVQTLVQGLVPVVALLSCLLRR